jgi:hypothetical protein
MNAHVPTDPRITAATPHAAALVEAVADHDAAATTAALKAAGVPEKLHHLVIVLAAWVDPDSPRATTTVPPAGIALARRVVADTARHYGLEPADLYSRRQVHDILNARAVASYAAHKLLGIASTTTGQALERDHSTVLNACGRVGEDPRLRRVAQSIAAELGWSREVAAS